MAIGIWKRGHQADGESAALEGLGRRRTHEALTESEECFKVLVENSSDLVAMVDGAGAFEFLSPSSEAILGYRPEELVGQDGFALVHPDDVELAHRTFGQSARREREGSQSAELRFRHKDGSWRILDVKAREVQNEAGAVWYILNSRDVTERKKVEGGLRESEERFRGIFEQGSVGVALVDLEQHFLRANGAFCDMLGYQENEILGRNILEVTAAEDREVTVEDSRALLAGDLSVLKLEKRYVRKDGEIVWARVSASRVMDKAGTPLGSVVTVQDVTEYKKVEESLRLAQFSVDHAGLSMFWADSEGRYVGVNDCACKRLGYSREEFLTMRISDLDPTAPSPWKDHWQELKQKGFLSFESIHETKTGELFPIQATANYVQFGGKEYNFGLVEDISERKRAEEALRLTQLTMDRTGDLIQWVAADGRVVQANESSCRRHGYSREEMLKKTIFDLDSTTTPEMWLEQFVTLKKQGFSIFESMHRTKDGELFPVEVSVNFVESDGKELVFGFARDISERKQAERELKESEEQLRQAQKMEAIGQLAGGIAHDFNNLLTVIMGNSSLILGAMEKEDPNRELVSDIAEVGERAAGLTRQILAFSRRQILRPQIIHLNDIALGMEPLLRRTLREDVELRLLLAPDLMETEVDPHQMEQVLMNLAVNARDSMPEGGHLTVETMNVELDRNYSRKHSEVAPGRYVTLAVSDTGYGMDERTKSRIFDPFFTTKEVGKGTGLGLSTVFGIVKQSGGSISVYSEPGKGSTFKVYLPISQAGSASQKESSEEMPVEGGRETVLVVEDEDSVRKLVAAILSRAGYEVLEASSMRGVGVALQRGLHSPDLLLTDVVLPGGRTGRAVAEMLCKRFENLRVLFMSGYTRGSVVHNGRLDEGIEFLEKPFTPETLLQKVRAVLDGSEPEAALPRDRSRNSKRSEEVSPRVR